MMCDRTHSVNVVRVKDNRSNTSAQSAAEFRQAALGGVRVKRVPGEYTQVLLCMAYRLVSTFNTCC